VQIFRIGAACVIVATVCTSTVVLPLRYFGIL
jgi:hypothetical protein